MRRRCFHAIAAAVASSTPSRQQCDVAVVGAGIMGSSAAWALASHLTSSSPTTSNKVILLEQHEMLHRLGSSHGESRIIRRTYPQMTYTEMMAEAYQLWEEVERQGNCKLITRTGGLDLGKSDQASLINLYNSAKNVGVQTDVLSREQVSDRFPLIKLPKDYIAILSDEAGVIRPTKACAQIQSLAKAKGAKIIENAKVLSAERLNSSGGVLLTSTAGEIEAQKVILAPGPWASKILDAIDTELELPLRPTHTTLAYWRMVDRDGENLIDWRKLPVFIDYTTNVYGTPSVEYPGLVKIGYHDGHEVDPDDRDFSPSEKVIKDIVTPWVRKHFDKVRWQSPALSDSCMYTCTPDGDYIIDYLPNNQDIILAAGFSGHGFKMGPLVAKIITEMVLGQSSELAKRESYLKQFALSRFYPKSNGSST